MGYHDFVISRLEYLDVKSFQKAVSEFWGPPEDGLIIHEECIGGFIYDGHHFIEKLKDGTFQVFIDNETWEETSLEIMQMRLYIEVWREDEEELERNSSEQAAKADTQVVIAMEDFNNERLFFLQQNMAGFLHENIHHELPICELLAERFINQWNTWQDFIEDVDDNAVTMITLNAIEAAVPSTPS